MKQALRCASLAPSLSVSLISLTFSIALSLSSACAVAWGVVICSVFSRHCALSLCVCVLIVAILGEGEDDEEDLFGSSRARFCGTKSAWSYRHLVRLKGKRKVDLLFLFSLLPPPLCFLLSLSLSLSFSSSLEKTAAVQPVHRHPTLTSPTSPINHGTLLTTVCLCGCECARKERNFVGQWLWQSLSRKAWSHQHQLIMLHNVQ